MSPRARDCYTATATVPRRATPRIHTSGRKSSRFLLIPTRRRENVAELAVVHVYSFTNLINYSLTEE